jgi:Ca2+-binding EF-hand superfamily protein
MEVYQGICWICHLPSRSRIGVLTVTAQSWEGVFHYFAKNNNNVIDGDELGQALERFGYKLSPQLQDLLKRKYGAGLSFEHPMFSAHCSRLLHLDVAWGYEEAAAGGGPAAAPPAGRRVSSGITFDRFMRACVVVKQLKESFEVLDRDQFGRVKIDYDTFLGMVLRLP